MNGRELKCERDEKSFRGRDTIIQSQQSVSSICKEISNEGEFRIEEKVYSRRIEINIRITIFEFVTFWII